MSPAAKPPCPMTTARGVTACASSLMIFLEIVPDISARGELHLADELLVQRFRGIDSRVAQQVIQRDHFGDHSDVFPGIQKNRDLRELDIEDGGGCNVEARALGDCVLI